MNLAFSVRPDEGETGVLVVSQQTIRSRRTSRQRYKTGILEESGRRSPLFVALGTGMGLRPPSD